MRSLNLRSGALALAGTVPLLVGCALAQGTALAAPPPPATCVVHSLPSFVAQGEFATAATVADVVEVECDPTVYGTRSKIRLTASQLYGRCQDDVTWYDPNPSTR